MKGLPNSRAKRDTKISLLRFLATMLSWLKFHKFKVNRMIEGNCWRKKMKEDLRRALGLWTKSPLRSGFEPHSSFHNSLRDDDNWGLAIHRRTWLSYESNFHHSRKTGFIRAAATIPIQCHSDLKAILIEVISIEIRKWRLSRSNLWMEAEVKRRDNFS